MTQTNDKPIPRSIGIFGAGGHLGMPLARYLRYKAPHISLRLITSSAVKAAQLQRDFPEAEVVQADYFDAPSIDAAVAGMEGLFVVTPMPFPETVPMTNLVSAVRKSGTLIHMIRILGLQPDVNMRRIPQELRDYGMGIELQHPIARQILDDADLPVTYFNMGASYMDNYLRTAPGICMAQTLVWPQRLIPYIDPRDAGEAAARIFLSDNHRHLYQVYTLNNGYDLLRTSDVAEIMSDVFQRPIRHDPSKETFLRVFQAREAQGLVPPGMVEYIWNFFQYEQDNETVWIPNIFLEQTLQRRPTVLRAWLQEHRNAFFPDMQPNAVPNGMAEG